MFWCFHSLCRSPLQVKQSIANGKLPCLRVFGSSYRDADASLVWRMCCLFYSSLPYARNCMDDAEFKECQSEFCKGNLDAFLIDKARAMDESMEFEDLGYIRQKVQGSMASWSPDALAAALNQAEHQKVKAEFELMATQVHAEELEWSKYMADMARHQDHERATVTAAIEQAEMEKEKAVAAHMASHFCVQSFSERAFAGPFFEASLAQFCNAVPMKDLNQALLINIFNMTVLDLSCFC